jgi:hypothetical protein
MMSRLNEVSLQNSTPTTSLINLKLKGNEITSKITPAKDTDSRDAATVANQSDYDDDDDDDDDDNDDDDVEETTVNKTRKAPNELLEEVRFLNSFK